MVRGINKGFKMREGEEVIKEKIEWEVLVSMNNKMRRK